MKNQRVTLKKWFILDIFLFFWHISTSVSAQPSEKVFIPEQFLPETTLAVCVFPNLQETVETFKQTLLSEILNPKPDPTPSPSPLTFREERKISAPPIFETIQQDFRSFADEFQRNAGFSLSDVWSIFHRSIAIALIDISEDLTTNRPYPEFACIADVTGTVDILKNLLETVVIPSIQTKEPTVEFFVESFAGINIYVLANKQFQVYYTFLDNIFVLALRQDTIQKVIAVSKPMLSGIEEPMRADVEESPLSSIAGYAISTLYSALAYRSVAKSMPEDQHEARIYVDIRNVWFKLRPYIRRICSHKYDLENTIVLDVLDQYNLQNLFWTFSYKDKGGYERLFLRTKNQVLDEKPVFSVKSTDLLNPPTDIGNGTFTSDQLVPANVLYYGVARVNLPEIWRRLSTLINASPYPQQTDLFNSWLRKIENTFHFDIEQELLAAFDQEIALACYAGEFRHKFARKSPALEEFPFFVLLQLKDKDMLERAFQKIFGSLQIESHSEIYQNTTIQAINIPGKIVPFTMYTAFVKDFLLVSGSQTIMQEVIAVSQYGESLSTTDDYRQLSAFFPAEGYSKGYINLKHVSELARRFLEQENQSEFSDRDKILTRVLDLVSLANQVSGMMWVTTVVSDGFLTESFSPVGGIVTGTALAWLGLSIMSNEQ